jgi:hypothetical protein
MELGDGLNGSFGGLVAPFGQGNTLLQKLAPAAGADLNSPDMERAPRRRFLVAVSET